MSRKDKLTKREQEYIEYNNDDYILEDDDVIYAIGYVPVVKIRHWLLGYRPSYIVLEATDEDNYRVHLRTNSESDAIAKLKELTEKHTLQNLFEKYYSKRKNLERVGIANDTYR